jgi:hypothetical protein
MVPGRYHRPPAGNAPAAFVRRPVMRPPDKTGPM